MAWPDSKGQPNRWLLSERAAQGELAEAEHAPTSGTAIILVLLPPRVGFVFGVQGEDSEGDNFEFVMRTHLARDDLTDTQLEQLKPVEIDLAPYFISKYEVTQGQWTRCFKENPSVAFPGQSRRRVSSSRGCIR